MNTHFKKKLFTVIYQWKCYRQKVWKSREVVGYIVLVSIMGELEVTNDRRPPGVEATGC